MVLLKIRPAASGSGFRVLFKIRPAASGSLFRVLFKIRPAASGSVFRVLFKIRAAASGSLFRVLFKSGQGIRIQDISRVWVAPTEGQCRMSVLAGANVRWCI